MKAFILVGIGILLLMCIPPLVIWSINTLFALDIAYTWETWLAAAVLIGAVGGTSVAVNRN